MRWEARAAHALTTFVGRRRELESLLTAAESVASGQGQLVALVGDAGIGKSRLVHEFTQLPQFDDWTLYQTGALPHGMNTSYLPLGILLRAIFKVGDRDDQAEIDSKMRTGLAQFVTKVDPLLPVIQVLMDLPVSDPNWAALNPQERASRIIDGAKNLLLQIADARPMLLVIEDLHWIDSESQRVLDSLVEGMAVHKILLVVTHRPEYQHHWIGKSFYTRTRVDPFAASSAHEMLDKLIGMDSSLESIKRLLIESARRDAHYLSRKLCVRSRKLACCQRKMV
jgi:predicted ATPase